MGCNVYRVYPNRNSNESEPSHFQRACQTSRVHRAEAEVQTLATAEAASQTEPKNPAAEQHLLKPEELDPDGLKVFLGRVEDTVVRQLVRNSRSHAFDGFQVNWKDPSNQVRRTSEAPIRVRWKCSGSAGLLVGTFCPQVSCHHSLHHPGGLERNLHVTKVSWSCTGAVLACAYGRCVCVT